MSIRISKTKPKTQTRAHQRKPKSAHKQTPKRTVRSSAPRVRGRGGYLGTLGAKLGSTAGGFLGQAAGDLVGSIFGSGTYTVGRNSLTSLAAGGPPLFLSNKDGSCVVAHREYIGDVSGSFGFTNTAYSINPGVATTFPWLAKIALNFEEYEMLGLIFEFKSTSATAIASTNTALGTVVMATDYNVDSTLFSTKQAMEAYQYSCATSPSASVIHPVECAPSENILKNMFVRTSAVPTGEDARFYDLGLFQLATQGMQATATIGELWVSYHVKLRKPKLVLSTAFASSGHYTANIFTGSSDFGSPTIVTGTSTDVVVSTVSGDLRFLFPTPGNYLITTVAVPNASAVLSGAFTLGTFTSCAPQSAWGPNKDNTTGTVTGSYGFANWLLKTTAVNASCYMAGPASATATSFCDVFISGLAPNQLTTKSAFSSRMRALITELLGESKTKCDEREENKNGCNEPDFVEVGTTGSWFGSTAMVATGQRLNRHVSQARRSTPTASSTNT